MDSNECEEFRFVRVCVCLVLFDNPFACFVCAMCDACLCVRRCTSTNEREVARDSSRCNFWCVEVVYEMVTRHAWNNAKPNQTKPYISISNSDFMLRAMHTLAFHKLTLATVILISSSSSPASYSWLADWPLSVIYINHEQRTCAHEIIMLITTPDVHTYGIASPIAPLAATRLDSTYTRTRAIQSFLNPSIVYCEEVLKPRVQALMHLSIACNRCELKLWQQ